MANNKILFIVGEPYSGGLTKAIKEISLKNKDKKLNEIISFYVRKNFSQITPKVLSNYNVFCIDTMYPSTEKIIKLIPKNKKIYSLREPNGGAYTTLNNRLIFDENIIKYFSFPEPLNTKNLLKYLLNKTNNFNFKLQKPQILKKVFIAHPDSNKLFTNYNEFLKWYKSSGHYKKDGFWIGINYYRPMVNNSMISSLVKQFESAGINVVVLYSFPDYLAVEKFLLPHKVDMLIGISFKFSASLDKKGKTTLQKLNVPVYNGISLYQTSETAWVVSDKGLTPFEVSFQVALPELAGLIEPTVIASKERIFDPYTQKDIFISKTIKYQVDWLIKRIKAMRKLQTLPNKDKRIAIFYYNHHPGKQNIGASYLNVMKSLSVILKALRKNGYNIPKNIKLDYNTLKNEMLLSGRNVGNYAPGEIEALVNSGKVVLLPITEYKKWIENVPNNFINPVYKKWGKPEDSKIMVYKGNFIIPMVKISKNVIILPQPSRGWGQSPLKMYHDVTLPPHHQYVAVYMWLKKVFKADAIINLGTHGTQEWLPGKQVGTIYWDNGDFLLQDIPLLYPYVMDDIGEAIQAKRRGRGIIISHLVPVMKKGNLFGKYLKLEDKIQQYNIALTKDRELADLKFKEIKRLVKKTGIDRDLKLKKVNKSSVEKIEHYLIDLKEQVLPYGLHTYGKINSKGAYEFAKLLSENYPKYSDNSTKYFFQKLKKSAQNEIFYLLEGLKGRYIPPGHGNDPIRSPDALPTGRNLYAFDSRKIPSKEAYKLAIKLVNDSIKKYRKEHENKYPKKVEIILWSVETCRDEGIAVSEALYYMGVKPVWDNKERIKGIEIIPAKILKRPRIDVVMQPSGLFRDMFPNLIKLLDRAVKMAAAQNDIENFIKENSLKIAKILQKEGYSKKQAKVLSEVRIFGAPAGAYGTMVAQLTGNSGLWDNSSQIAEVYINRLSYGYSDKFWGKPMKDIFRKNLKDVDTVIHTLSSNLYGTMDNDDFFQYAGGAVLAVKEVKGKSPALYISRSINSKKVYVEDINRTIGKEFRMRYTNPEWIKGMEKEGYAGAREMSKFVDYMWGWQVTVPYSIDKTKWRETFEVYVKDKYKLGLKRFFQKENPWAYQSITARMLEAVRKGYWKPGKRVVQKLAVEYALNVINRGVACCDHTCNNPALNQMVVNIISLPGVMSPELVQKFKAIISKAMGKSLDKAVKDREKLLKKLSNIVKKMKYKNVNGKFNAKKLVKGYELKEETKKEKDSQATSSGIQWYLMAFVLFVIFIMIAGMVGRKKEID